MKGVAADGHVPRPAPASCQVALDRLGSTRPVHLDVVGNTRLLERQVTSIFCSRRPPGGVLIEAYDAVRSLLRRDRVFIGGFHSPLEREMLEDLLAGGANLILCPARGREGMRLRAPLTRAMAAGRLLVIFAQPPRMRRPDARSCDLRNRLCATLSNECVILHATPGGRLFRLALELVSWRIPLLCLDHPANEDLRLLGAAAIRIRDRRCPDLASPV